jgi:hypothetical protein
MTTRIRVVQFGFPFLFGSWLSLPLFAIICEMNVSIQQDKGFGSFQFSWQKSEYGSGPITKSAQMEISALR